MNYSPLQPLPLAGGAYECDVPLWLGHHQDLLGGKAVLYLYDHPDRLYHVSDLSDLAWGGGILLQTEHNNFCRLSESAIPMTDLTALNMCGKELRELIQRIGAAERLGYTDLASELRRQFDAILKYRKETTTPTGKIRDFPSQEMREYQRVFNAFRRLLMAAQKEAPEVYEVIKKHVKTGLRFAWLTNPDKISGKRVSSLIR